MASDDGKMVCSGCRDSLWPLSCSDVLVALAAEGHVSKARPIPACQFAHSIFHTENHLIFVHFDLEYLIAAFVGASLCSSLWSLSFPRSLQSSSFHRCLTAVYVCWLSEAFLREDYFQGDLSWNDCMCFQEPPTASGRARPPVSGLSWICLSAIRPQEFQVRL